QHLPILFMSSGGHMDYFPDLEVGEPSVYLPLDRSLHRPQPGEPPDLVEPLHGFAGSFSRVERIQLPDGRIAVRKTASMSRDKGKLWEEGLYLRQLQNEGNLRTPKVYDLHRDGGRVTLIEESIDAIPATNLMIWANELKPAPTAAVIWDFICHVFRSL